jgi:hypothetical protein
MSVKLTAIRLQGGSSHQYISMLAWQDLATGQSDTCTRAAMVQFIDGRGQAYVEDPPGPRVEVVVVAPSVGSKYVRTRRDGRLTDNLLALPRF